MYISTSKKEEKDLAVGEAEIMRLWARRISGSSFPSEMRDERWGDEMQTDCTGD